MAGFRTPSLYELFSNIGNRNLRPERSKGFDAGVSQALFGGRFVVGATYFDNKVDNLISFSGSRFNQSTSRVNTSGVELEASITPFDWLSLAANYTYTEVKSADTNSRLLVPDHTVNFTATVRPVDKLEVSVNGQYAEGARQPITRRLDPYFIMGASLSYEIRENTTLYARAENIFDRRYQTVRGYGSQPRMLYVGVRGSF